LLAVETLEQKHRCEMHDLRKSLRVRARPKPDKTYIANGRNVIVVYANGFRELYLSCEWADFSDGLITITQAERNAKMIADMLNKDKCNLEIPEEQD